jgi:hypothetical protein
MSVMRRLLPVTAAVIVLLFSGIVHGVWTERWGEASDLNEAVARLERLPLDLGDWKGEPIASANRKGGGLAGSVSCRYLHRPTGKEVTVFLGCGRPAVVAIHTPDVCYAASGFELEPTQEFTLPAASSSAGAVFYTARAKKTKAGDQTKLRIFWSWHAAGKWAVADTPRMAFVDHKILYKVYFIRELNSATEPLADDPCVQLMEKLLPRLQAVVQPKL